MLVTTREQRIALFKVFQRDFPNWLSPYWRRSRGELVRVPSYQWRRFRRRIAPSFDGSGCVMLHWKGMWLGIEKDGYTHS